MIQHIYLNHLPLKVVSSHSQLCCVRMPRKGNNSRLLFSNKSPSALITIIKLKEKRKAKYIKNGPSKKKTAHYDKGKIQGDGRKFLDRFKSYSGSQISSQSLNEIHICRLQPKSATTKVSFFHIFLFLIVSSSRLMLPFDV